MSFAHGAAYNDTCLCRCRFFLSAGLCGGAEYLAALRERNILVRHWKSERIKDYVRITVGTQAQMETLIDVTKELMK